ncbi:MAG TPA: MMPL family transporter [Thermoanaerobaculia bacterium]|nr:MMPL family transporter [Thermoanaerobaculia bacterium]
MSLRARALAVLVLLAVAGAAVLAARRVEKLRIRANDLELLPADAEVLRVDKAVRDTFGSGERVILCLTNSRREVTDPVFLEDVRFFGREMGRSSNIRMLLFDRLARARYSAGAVPGEPWLLHQPDGAWIAAALRHTAVRGKLGAGRSRHTAFLEAPVLFGSGVQDIERRAREALARLDQRRPGEYTLRVVGRQVVLNGLGEALFQDLQLLLPWTMLIIFLLFGWVFRSLWMAGLAVLQSGLCVLFTMAVLQMLGHPVSITTAMIPVLLTVLGIADDLHLYSEYLRLRQQNPGIPTFALVWRGVRKVFFPCTATTLTTVIGFASFLPTDVPGLCVFGLVAGIGVCFSWLLTTMVVPVLLALIPLRRLPEWTLEPRVALPPFLVRGAVPVALTLLVVPGILRLRIDDGWTQNFRPDHPIVKDVHWFERESVGVYQFDVMLTRRDGRPWTEPDLLRSAAALQEEVERTPGVTASLSLADLVRDRAWELGDPAAERPPLPATRPETERLLRTYRYFNEDLFLRMFLDRGAGSTRLIFATSRDDYATSTAVRRALDESLRRVFPPGAVQARIGGSAERGRVLIESVTSSQGISVLASLGMSWLTLGFASRRWRTSGRCILAIVWALALVLGIAGWAGIPLGVASSCFLALGVGIGLDYGIHLGFGHRADGEGEEGAVYLRVLTNVFIVGVGLSVLLFSSNPTIARLGLLIVLSMAASGYTAISAFSGSILGERLPERSPRLAEAPPADLVPE